MKLGAGAEFPQAPSPQSEVKVINAPWYQRSEGADRLPLPVCYVDHHDDAYAWAGRRKIERHPKTGAAQSIEVCEAVEEERVQAPIQATARTPTVIVGHREAPSGENRLHAPIVNDLASHLLWTEGFQEMERRGRLP